MFAELGKTTELYLDEVLQHHINHTILTEYHIYIMSSVSTTSYNYKTDSQRTLTHTQTQCILVEKQKWPVMQREVRWWMTCGWFYRLGKRPRGWLWPVQGPTITSLNKTAWKESPYPIVSPVQAWAMSTKWSKSCKIRANATNNEHCFVMAL